MNMFWELRHSVIANAHRQTVWEFVSNIDNLARVEGDAVESMTLDGPFQAGTRGATKMRGQEPTHWRLAEVEPRERATYEMELSGAVVRFAWTYEELTDGRTRMSQHIVLEGSGAEAYVPLMEQYLAPNAVQGMERLAEEIAKYAAGK
jgi:Polyketide cyclase / dehydrase and lipid transport